jgi:hypothetical protein
MQKCSNCETDADIAYVGAGSPILYCNAHLPGFLMRPEYKHTLLPAQDAAPVVEPVVEAPTAKSSKKKTTSDATADETTAPAEEPTP